MGEIPPLPESMRPDTPEVGKELTVSFNATKSNDTITIATNLPDNYILLVKSNLTTSSTQMPVKNGSITIINAKDITEIILGSAFNHNPTVLDQLGGKRSRNLIGEFVKFDPIHGNEIRATFHF